MAATTLRILALDGKIADTQGRSKWISGEAARRFFWKLRPVFDAMAVGVSTASADRPSLTSHGLGRNPLRVVFDPHLRLPRGSPLLSAKEAGTVLVASNQDLERFAELSNQDAELMLVSENGRGLGLKESLGLLALKGVQTLLVEGGGETHAHFLEQGLVDEVLWCIAPKLLGGKAARPAVGGMGLKMPGALCVRSWRTHALGPDLVIHGTCRRDRLFWSVLHDRVEQGMAQQTQRGAL